MVAALKRPGPAGVFQRDRDGQVDRPMNIALIAPPWYPVPPSGYGGIELVVALLAQEFERRGHRVTVLANGDSRPAGALRSPLRSTPSKGMIGNAFIEAGHVLGTYAEIDGADIIHDHSGALGPALASRDSSLPPVVHTLHGPWTPEASEFYRFVRRAHPPRRDQRRTARRQFERPVRRHDSQWHRHRHVSDERSSQERRPRLHRPGKSREEP